MARFDIEEVRSSSRLMYADCKTRREPVTRRGSMFYCTRNIMIVMVYGKVR